MAQEMAQGLDEREATLRFRFIEENSQLSRFGGHFVSRILRHKKHANKNGTSVTVRSKGGISTDTPFRLNLSIFPALSVSCPAISVK